MYTLFCLTQLENLVYFNRLKHSKIVISDFHLAKLENGLIKDPCGTPEYLGELLGNGADHRRMGANGFDMTVMVFGQLESYILC